MTEPLTTWRFALFVPGKAEPQGSKTRGRFSIYDDNPKTKPWRERVALAANERMRAEGWGPLPPKTPITVTVEFVLPRLASAPKTKPHPPAVAKPDLDKLVRAIFDALTGPVWHDDANVITLHTDKRRAALLETPGTHITVEALR